MTAAHGDGEAESAARAPTEAEHPEAATPDLDQAKRRQILVGAHRVFMTRGFDGASMGAIARTAGVSKGTLYVYFASKEALFAATVADERDRIRTRFDLEKGGEDVEDSLKRIGRALVAFIAHPANIRAVRTVMGISERFPAVGRAFYEDGPGRGVEKFTRFIEAHARAGRLEVEDARIAAMQLQMLFQAGVVNELLYDVREAPDDAEIGRLVDEAVKTFLARYGKRP